jgi:protoporphyrin/coproporphyrin ferrochelatase
LAQKKANKTGLKAAFILINMGGPENPGEVKSFIRSLFLDPHIIEKSKISRRFLSWIISTFRTPKVKKHYEAIGGGSPIKKWTELQAEKSGAILKAKYPNLIYRTAYSYSQPMIAETLAELANKGLEKIIAFPLYPQYSKATLGSIYSDLSNANRILKLAGKLITMPPFYEDHAYIECTAKLIKAALEKIDQSRPYHVVFSAHALPQKLIEAGDPYGMQIDRTIYLLLKRLPLENYTISFQSKIGPVKWMQPSTIETVKSIAGKGIKQLLVVPIGFVCDHIETLYELDIELAGIAKKSGVENFVRAGVFNDDDCFIQFLASRIEEHLK